MKVLNSWFVTCWGFVFVFCFSKMQIYKKNKNLEHFLGLENIHFKLVELFLEAKPHSSIQQCSL